ncbi:MAG: 4Fe-4S dicluster domain-containing protein [Terriglobales bacterium]
MAAIEVIPICDPTLLNDIRRYGKFDPTGCYQCGSCTLSCDLVQDGVSFPRRSIRFALLGLRQPLLHSLEPWICHDCGDCSVVCPRHAEPRISMLTLRRFLSAQYDWTGMAARLIESEAWYIGSLVFVAVLTLGLIVGYHLWYVGMGAKDFVSTPMGLEHMFPIIKYYTMTVVLIPLLLLVSRLFRIWRLTMNEDERARAHASTYMIESWTYVYESVTHSLFRKCHNQTRWMGHWLLAFGTVVMLVTKFFALRWFQTDNVYPFYNPQRWIGYLAAVFILYGLGDILVGRLRAKKEIYKETRWQDLAFPALLIATVVSGLSAHIFRYFGFALACHFLYAAHIIIATPMLLVEMSFGKWSHMVYRPLARYLLAVRERAGRQTPAAEVVTHAL